MPSSREVYFKRRRLKLKLLREKIARNYLTALYRLKKRSTPPSKIEVEFQARVAAKHGGINVHAFDTACEICFVEGLV